MNKKFYETEEFKSLKKEWDGRLKKAGFRDIEALKEPAYNTTISIQNQQQSAEMHTYLGHFLLNTNQRVPRLHRKILSQWLYGRYSNKEIADQLGISTKTI